MFMYVFVCIFTLAAVKMIEEYIVYDLLKT